MTDSFAACGLFQYAISGTSLAKKLPLGFVDIKVCAVSDVWSGLKLVVRKTLR